jgi:hypothetical protein
MTAAPSLGGCVPMGNALVNMAPSGIHRRIVGMCHTCERRTPQIMRCDGAWYGVTIWCVACLDGWMDGYRLERPFRRYWKRDRASFLRDMWDTALMPDEYSRWTGFDVHRATECEFAADCAGCAAFGFGGAR